MKRAQIELAVYLHNNTDGIGLSGLEDYKRAAWAISKLNLTKQALWVLIESRLCVERI